jgi:hypothetical protein
MSHKGFFLTLFFCGFAFISKAQILATTPYEYAIGVSAGTTFSSVAFTPRVMQSTRLGTTFGLTGRMTMGEYVGLQLELNYSQQGWKERYEDEDGQPLDQYKYSRLLNYLQLPFYTHVQFGSKKVKGFVQAGPQIGYMIGESTDQNLNGANPGRVNAQHNLAVQKKFEWGIGGGGGIDIRTGIGSFVLEGRYLYELGDIYNARREDPFSKASGQVFTVKLSFLKSLVFSR